MTSFASVYGLADFPHTTTRNLQILNADVEPTAARLLQIPCAHNVVLDTASLDTAADTLAALITVLMNPRRESTTSKQKFTPHLVEAASFNLGTEAREDT